MGPEATTSTEKKLSNLPCKLEPQIASIYRSALEDLKVNDTVHASDGQSMYTIESICNG